MDKNLDRGRFIINVTHHKGVKPQFLKHGGKNQKGSKHSGGVGQFYLFLNVAFVRGKLM